MKLIPFRALRYDPRVAGPTAETSAPPYDAFDPVQYAEHRTANPYTVLELQTGEADGGQAGFHAAQATLARWRRTGVLVEDPTPSLYLYEEHELRHGVPTVQRGIIAAIGLEELERGRLLPHEHVDPERAALRAERMRQVPVDLTPVVALHSSGRADRADASGVVPHRDPPVVAFTDESNVDHRLWRISDPAAIDAVIAAYDGTTAVLADGHHRVAAARRLAAEPDRPVGWGCVTVWLVDALTHGPELRAVHRLMPGLPPSDDRGAPSIDGFRAHRWDDSVTALERALTELPGLTVGLITPTGSWVLRAEDPRGLRLAAAPGQPALQDLDAQVAETVILPILRTGEDVAGHGDAADVEQEEGPEAVFELTDGIARIRRSGTGSVVVLAPPTAEQVMRVAQSGLRMPAKTTWFRPKPRAGLVMRSLDDPR